MRRPGTPMCACVHGGRVQGSKPTYLAAVYKVLVTADTVAMYTFPACVYGHYVPRWLSSSVQSVSIPAIHYVGITTDWHSSLEPPVTHQCSFSHLGP